MHFYSRNRHLALLPTLFLSAVTALSRPTSDFELSEQSTASDSSAILESLQIGTSNHRLRPTRACMLTCLVKIAIVPRHPSLFPVSTALAIPRRLLPLTSRLYDILLSPLPNEQLPDQPYSYSTSKHSRPRNLVAPRTLLLTAYLSHRSGRVQAFTPKVLPLSIPRDMN
jgi:hypothetical protein